MPHEITARVFLQNSPNDVYYHFYAIETFSFLIFLYLCILIMETSENTIESQIAAILCDIRQKGYSSVQPFSIGKVEERMALFAQVNAITLASDELFMSAKQLQHCMRASKATKGLVVTDADLIGFPQNRFQMDLSEGNQAARSNCSSSRRCHRSAHRGSTWLLLSRCKDRRF